MAKRKNKSPASMRRISRRVNEALARRDDFDRIAEAIRVSAAKLLGKYGFPNYPHGEHDGEYDSHIKDAELLQQAKMVREAVISIRSVEAAIKDDNAAKAAARAYNLGTMVFAAKLLPDVTFIESGRKSDSGGKKGREVQRTKRKAEANERHNKYYAEVEELVERNKWLSVHAACAMVADNHKVAMNTVYAPNQKRMSVLSRRLRDQRKK